MEQALPSICETGEELLDLIKTNKGLLPIELPPSPMVPSAQGRTIGCDDPLPSPACDIVEMESVERFSGQAISEPVDAVPSGFGTPTSTLQKTPSSRRKFTVSKIVLQSSHQPHCPTMTSTKHAFQLSDTTSSTDTELTTIVDIESDNITDIMTTGIEASADDDATCAEADADNSDVNLPVDLSSPNVDAAEPTSEQVSVDGFIASFHQSNCRHPVNQLETIPSEVDVNKTSLDTTITTEVHPDMHGVPLTGRHLETYVASCDSNVGNLTLDAMDRKARLNMSATDGEIIDGEIVDANNQLDGNVHCAIGDGATCPSVTDDKTTSAVLFGINGLKIELTKLLNDDTESFIENVTSCDE